jgi:hypothetical protein
MEVELVSDDADVASYGFVLDGRPVTVGRSLENDVCLGDPEVSRRHCEFEQFEDLIVVSDLDSSNGTFVNGLRIKQVTLEPGDKLTLGRRAFRIRYDRDSTRFAAFDQASPLTKSMDYPELRQGKWCERLLHRGRFPRSLEAAVDSGLPPDVTSSAVSSESRGIRQ